MTFKRFVDAVQGVALVCVAAFIVLLFFNEPDSSADAPAAATADGAAVYASSCAGCHGDDGSGGIGPRLSGGAVVEAFPDPAEEIEVVTEGRAGMPAFGTRLTAEEIAAVVEHTRSL